MDFREQIALMATARKLLCEFKVESVLLSDGGDASLEDGAATAKKRKHEDQETRGQGKASVDNELSRGALQMGSVSNGHVLQESHPLESLLLATGDSARGYLWSLMALAPPDYWGNRSANSFFCSYVSLQAARSPARDRGVNTVWSAPSTGWWITRLISAESLPNGTPADCARLESTRLWSVSSIVAVGRIMVGPPNLSAKGNSSEPVCSH
jgi:hypothetical protein